MLTATFHNQTIHLSTYPRKEWYKLVQASKQKQLFCTYCHQPVVFEHTFYKSPSFRHLKQVDCEKEKQETLKKYKKAKRLKIKEPFQKVIVGKQPLHPLYTHLKNCGFPLNQEQWQAVTTIDQPLLVAAGPGSGKTRVLTARVAYILQEKNVMPNEILLITFTKKAATEMIERLQAYELFPTKTVNQIICGTFHSVFYRILRYHEPEKWKREHLLSKEWQKEALLRQAAKQLGINEQELIFDELLQSISFYKNQGKTPEDCDSDRQTAKLYKQYETIKKETGQFDFDDMLIGCLQFFKKNTNLLQRYQERFRYVMVDECQDINFIQYEIIRLLTHSSNLCFVGDDDQTIYSFRGSSPNFFLKMKEDFQNVETVVLVTNYRSSHEIVTASKHLIEHNYKRIKKQLHATFQTKKGPIFFFPYNEEEEAYFITDYITKQRNKHSEKTIAILCRTHAQSRAILEHALWHNQPVQAAKTIEQYYNRPVPKVIRSYFSLALNPNDEEALKGILPSLFLKRQIFNEVRAQSVLHDVSLLDALPLAEGIPSFQKERLETIANLLPKIREIEPTRALTYIEHDLGLKDYIKKRSDEKNRFDGARDDLKQLTVAMHSFTSLAEWLDYLDELIIREKSFKQVSSNVSILSIHQSKGLEFDEVFILGVNQGLLPHDFALEAYKKDKNASFLEEERRLLYVAMTRARKKLFFSILETYQTEKANQSSFLPKF